MRRSPWSARPARARPRSPLSSRGSTASAAAGSIGGVDVRDYSLVELRSLVATAFEEPAVLDERQRTSRSRRSTPPGRSRERSRSPGDFVHDLPWGLDTGSASRACRSRAVSGGASPGPCRARAAQGAGVNDTLSALDIHTEKLVEEALSASSHPRPAWSSPTASTVLLADGSPAPGRHDHPRQGTAILATVRRAKLLAADSRSREASA